MSERRRADTYGAGEEFPGYSFLVTEEFNENYLHAQEDFHSRYLDKTSKGLPIVHSALLFNASNVTRSPGFYLAPGMAAVHSHEEVRFLNPGWVGKRFSVSWRVVETYERRGRPYQVVDALIVDEDGREILRRKSTNTYTGGLYPGAS